MLNQVLQTQPYQYVAPVYATNTLLGVMAVPAPTPNGPSTIYLYAQTIAHVLGNLGWSSFTFDGTSGAYMSTIFYNIGVFTSGYLIQSRNGGVYLVGPSVFNQSSIISVSPDNLSTPAWGASKPASLWGLGGFGNVGVDESVDVFINGHNQQLDVYAWSNGAYRYTVPLPFGIVSICLQNTNIAYVLCGNNVLVVIDYTMGKIIGAVRLPPPFGGGYYPPNNGHFGGSVQIGWDNFYNRLLVVQQTADVGGADTTYVVGYSMQKVATRLTTPIPLKSPLTKEQIPVNVQLVDDMNMGLGGALINPSITSGTSSIIGASYTNARGDAFIQVECASVAETDAINCSVTV